MTRNEVTIIEARPKSVPARLRALWQYRGFYPFLLKEISMKKFRDTLFGFWWLIIRPLVPTAMAIVAFTFIVKMESHGLPYAVFYLAGFMSWTLFQALLTFMPRTLLWMQGLMKKTYFPKMLVPFASLGPPAIEFLVVLVLFALSLLFFYLRDGVLYLQIDRDLLLFPVFVFMTLLFGIAIGMVTSVIALFLRDIVFSVAYFAQMFMFLTPVLYPITLVPPEYRWIVYSLNPMAKIVEGSRWSLTGQGELDLFFTALSFGTIFAVFVLGCVFFMRAETYLADAI